MLLRRLLATAAAAIALGAVLGMFTDVSAVSLSLTWYTVDGGGHTFSTGHRLELGGTIGQPDAGTLTGGHFVLSGGFWLGGAAGLEDIEDPAETETDEIAFHVAIGLPNPFADATAIRLELPEARPVEASVYDHTGRLVRVLCDRDLPPGHHRYIWDGRSGNGHRVASGVYLVKVRAGADEIRQRVIVLR